MKTLLATAALATVFSGAHPAGPTVNLAVQASPAATAKILPLTPTISTALVDTAASYFQLKPKDFVGLATGTDFYAYDSATSTYWAGASVVPSAKSQQAQVVVQDDGGYIIFHKPANKAWQAQEDGMASGKEATCASYHVNIPPAVLAVWHWPAGTCQPPFNGAPDFYLAKDEWEVGAEAISAAEGQYWTAAAADLRHAVSVGDPGTAGFSTAATELSQLASLPDAMQTAAQQKEYGHDVKTLDVFFGTKGLYQ